MKNIRAFLLIILLSAGLSSCEDFFGDVNVNPNSPTDVSMSVLLPAIEVEIAELTGGAFSRFSSVLMQQTEGVARQWASINNYSSFNPQTLNTAWTNTYANILNEIQVLKAKAVETGSDHYLGIAQVLESYMLIMTSAVWDDMPYTEAFQGTDITKPVFDAQEALYSRAQTLLTEARNLLSGNAGAITPGEEDLIYGGDASLWLKAANALLARASLHLSGKDSKGYTDALAFVADAFDASDENLGLQYGTGETEAAQWYRFNRDRTGDIEFHPQMAALLTSLNDTARLNLFSPTFVTGHPYMVPDYFQEFITYRELKFIEAEALLRTGGDPAAIREAYLEGIRASFEHAGVPGYEAYIAQPVVDPGVGNITLEDILTQKYIGLYTQPEVYNDWRRTGLPALSPTSGSAIPVRWPYGEDETIFNAENVPSVNIFSDRVWWNQ